MDVLIALVAVAVLAAIPYVATGAMGLDALFGVAIPYLAIVVFIVGMVWRVLKWASAPVPFNITTVAGQGKSFPWIRSSYFDAPHTKLGVVGRMALEVLLFRSLIRNTKSEFVSRSQYEPKLAYKANIWLWVAALVFHYSFLVVFLRHYRFFSDPVPFFVAGLETLDGFFQVGSPTIFLSGFALLAAAGYLFLRRVADDRMRYLSMATDYFPLFLIMAIAGTGMLMRYTPLRVDIVAVKNFCIGLMVFRPNLSSEISPLFYTHIFLVSALFIYFPFSKLVHFGGIFLSPSRNLVASSRMTRHVNPWNPEVPVHTYEEYEDEFRGPMKAAGIPVEKEEA